MARLARPIDPNQGPVEAFAVELRRLRKAAGEPTYRAMAMRAGFSATTLSEAAGGMRKPSLDVTLAFVAVCGGDLEAWRARWNRLDGELAARRPSAVAAAPAVPDPTDSVHVSPRAAGPVAVDAAGEDAVGGAEETELGDVAPLPGHHPTERPGHALTRPAGLLVGVLSVIATLAVAGAILVLLRAQPVAPVPAAQIASSRPAGCPATASAGVAFSGETYVEGTHEHGGASLDAPVIAELPADCVLTFSGYCLGESLRDQRSGTPDMRWFKLTGGGVIASAVVHGNPPVGLLASTCAGDAPPPAAVHLHIAAAAGVRDMVILSATGVNAPIVGFAAYYSRPGNADADEAPSWHEVALMDPAYQPSPQWKLTDVHAAISPLPGSPVGTVPVVAVACLGGGAPTEIAEAAALFPAGPAQTVPVQLAPDVLTAAEQAACAYPVAG